MPISPDIISRTLASPHGEQAYRVCERLHDSGWEAWWVGGCVRDMLLREVPTEIDIATDAHPDAVAALFGKSDNSAAALGSVIVSSHGHAFEVTTFREDHALSDGRTPESVTFTDRAHDAERRDITINALYWNPISGEVSDPFDGERDLRERLVRFIGDPDTRIAHDALRLLRVIRFRALIDGQYHPGTFAAIHKGAKRIGVLSGTRQFEELEKMLLGPHPGVAFEDMWETDVIEYLLPELHACKGVGQPGDPHTEGDVWNHIIKVISSFTEDHAADVRWAALLHDIGKPMTFNIENDRIHFNEHASAGAKIAKRLLDRLQCRSDRRDKIVWLVAHHMMMGTFSDVDDIRKAHWYYHPWFVELLQLFWLDIRGTGKQGTDLYDRIIEDYSRFLDANPRPMRPLLDGNEVMQILGIAPGERVGEVLQRLHEAQLRKEVTTKAEARAFLKNSCGG